jgi:hypothetical protein
MLLTTQEFGDAKNLASIGRGQAHGLAFVENRSVHGLTKHFHGRVEWIQP